MITTRENLVANNAQGLSGELTVNNIEIVSGKMIDLALKGKRIYIPGFANKIIAVIGKVLPTSLAAIIIHSRWEKAQAKWLSK